MTALVVGGVAAGREVELDAAALAALPDAQQVPDVGALAEGRRGRAVRLAALLELAAPTPAARVVHVESEDGGFTANLSRDEAAAGLVLYALDGAELPRGFGGPFRLLFPDAEDCSVNVKFLGRVELLAEPGSHTARCAD